MFGRSKLDDGKEDMGVPRDNDQPSDGWVPVDTSPIKVDISGLQDFAKLLNSELKDDFQVNMQQGVVPMLQVAAPFGGGGLHEGSFFRQAHDRTRGAIGGLLGDVTLGLQSLSLAATSIYFEYLGGDNLGSATLDDVMNAFYPPPGMMTLQQKIKQDNNGQVPDATQDPKQAAEDARQRHLLYQTGGNPNDLHPENNTSSDYNPDDPLVIAQGQAGQYTIQGDADQMNDAPPDPMLK
jgi:hypothetical protein